MSAPGLKGVMLAERPAGGDGSSGLYDLAAFVPSSATAALTPWGLTPVRTEPPPREIKAPVGVSSLYRHWLKQYEGTLNQQREAASQDQQENSAKHQSVTQFGEKLRTAILSGEDVSFWTVAQKQRSMQGRPQGSSGSPNPNPNPHPNDSMHREREESEEQRKGGATNTEEAGSVGMLGDRREGNGVRWEQGTGEGAKPDLGGTGDEPSDGPTQQQHQQQGQAHSPPPPKTSPPPVGATGKRPSSSSRPLTSKSSKPAWALSGAEVNQAQQSEEDELLAFAESLDFDNFIAGLDDVELKETMQALDDAEVAEKGGDEKAWRSNFVRAMNNVAAKRASQQAQLRRMQKSGMDGDDGAGSVAGQSEGNYSVLSRGTAASRAKADAGALKAAAIAAGAGASVGGWDSSSKAGDDVAHMEAVQKAQEADSFLRENPDMKAVHSIASVRAMLGRMDEEVVV